MYEVYFFFFFSNIIILLPLRVSIGGLNVLNILRLSVFVCPHDDHDTSTERGKGKRGRESRGGWTEERHNTQMLQGEKRQRRDQREREKLTSQQVVELMGTRMSRQHHLKLFW